MAKIYAGLLAGLGQLPIVPPEAGQGVNSFVHVHRQVINYASQPTTDTPVIARIPAGHVVLGVELTADTSSGSATIAIGNATTPAKYKAAAAFTTTDTPTMFMKASAADDAPLTADEEVLITIAAAALPSSGILVTKVYTAKP